jgi:glycosyltransferase involved in cell wall biosynthesis
MVRSRLDSVKIAIISTMSGSAWGGSEELWAAMAMEALEAGLDVAVSVYDWPSMPPKLLDLEQRGARVFRRALQQRRGFFERVLRRLTFPSWKIMSFEPDVFCISQGGTFDSLSVDDIVSVLYGSGKPYIVICHSNSEGHVPDDSLRRAAREFFLRARSVLFVSQRTLAITERQLASTLDNALVVRNPVNLFELSPVLWPSSATPCLASVGYLQATLKGQDVLLDALGREVWRRRDWRLRLYGEGLDRGYLEALAQHYGISERIGFMGYVSDVRAIWGENHCLVLPSRVESAPLVLVEAMLCGRPSVVTDVGGIREWVEDQQTGFIADAPTARSFGEALERAWIARADWKRIGLEARKSALSKVDLSAGRKLLDIILDGARSG